MIQPQQKHGPLQDTAATKTWPITGYNHNKNTVHLRIQPQQKHGPLQDTNTTKQGPLQDTTTTKT